MGLVIERHPSDVIKTSKIKIVIDKAEKFKLLPGEKVEADVAPGVHRVDCSLNLLKSSAEITYPRDGHVVVSYRLSPAGIDIKAVPAGIAAPPEEGCFFRFQSALYGVPGDLSVTQDGICFVPIGKEPIRVSYDEIGFVGSSLGNLAVRLFSGNAYIFQTPREQAAVIDFVKCKVGELLGANHSGFDLCFGIDDKIFVNEAEETFYIQKDGKLSAVYPLGKILSYSAGEVGARQNFVGDAAVGTLVDGARGAFFGALHAAQNGSKVEAVRMNLTVRTETDIVAWSLNFSEPFFAMEKGGKKYDAAAAQCARFVAFMDDYKSRKSADVAARLEKCRELLAAGLITEEDFAAVKKQLLGI